MYPEGRLRALALSSFQSEQPRHRGSYGRARYWSQLRVDPVVVYQIRHEICEATSASAPGLRRYFFIDEVFVKIQGKQHYLWRAVDQDGDVVDVFLQHRRNGQAAKRFFKRLLKVYGAEPSFHINQLEPESGSCGDSNPHRFFRARSLPLGCNAPLRLGNV